MFLSFLKIRSHLRLINVLFLLPLYCFLLPFMLISFFLISRKSKKTKQKATTLELFANYTMTNAMVPTPRYSCQLHPKAATPLIPKYHSTPSTTHPQVPFNPWSEWPTLVPDSPSQLEPSPHYTTTPCHPCSSPRSAEPTSTIDVPSQHSSAVVAPRPDTLLQ